MLLALVPVLFYLFRQLPRKRTVSTLLFWELPAPEETETRRWHRLRRWISLLLQILFVLLLCLALGQPVWKAWQDTPPATVFVLDASPSMATANGTNASPWEEALAQLHQRFGQLRANEEVSVILATPEPHVLLEWNNHPRRAQEALNQAELAPTAAAWPETLRLARNLRQSRPESEVVVLSNLVWAEWPEEEWEEEYQLLTLPIDPFHNTGITRFAARRSLFAPGEYTVSAEILHAGDAPFRGEALLYRDEALHDLRSVELEPGEEWTHQWNGNSAETHAFQLVLEPNQNEPPQSLSSDLQADLSLPAFPSLEVAFHGTPHPFLIAAFRAQPSLHWSSDTNGSPDLTVYYQSVPAEFESRPDHPVLLIQPPENGFWGERGSPVERPVVLHQKQDHPLLSHVDLSLLRLQQTSHWTPPPATEIFLESREAPLLFGRWDARQKWLVLPFALEESDFALRAAFPIFVGNLLQTLRPAQDPIISQLPGPVSTRGSSLTPPSEVRTIAEPTTLSWFHRFPLWQFVLLLGLAWLFVEWWTYSRRHTE